MNRRTFALTGSVALASSLTAFGPSTAAQKVPSDAVEAAFLRTIDGEKFRVMWGDGEKEIRLIGVDAPEPKIDDNITECFAFDSRDLLNELLDGQVVFLGPDVEDNDVKLRLWRYVWADVDGEKVMINEYVLSQGWATVHTNEKNIKHQKDFIAAEKIAKRKSLGMWESCKSAHESIPRHGSAEDPGEWGETLEAEGVAVTPDSAFTAYEHNYSTPKGGYKFLIFNAHLENVGSEKKGYSASRFLAKDLETNAEHKEVFVLLDQRLEAIGDLSPSSYVYGEVAIELQETATNLRLKYQVNAAGGPSLYWLLKV